MEMYIPEMKERKKLSLLHYLQNEQSTNERKTYPTNTVYVCMVTFILI